MHIVPSLFGRDALLAQAYQHPYAVITCGGPNAVGYQRDDSLVWLADGPWGPMCGSMGDAETVVDILLELVPTGVLDGLHCHVPQNLPKDLARQVGTRPELEWDFLWLDQPQTHSPVCLETLTADDKEEIEEILQDALPDSSTRPGDPQVRSWHGIRENGRLLAVAADRSTNGSGFLAGIAVRQSEQGKGYGAAITSELTSSLYAEFGMCALAVMTANTHAIRLYERLGYTHRLPRTSIRFDRTK